MPGMRPFSGAVGSTLGVRPLYTVLGSTLGMRAGHFL